METNDGYIGLLTDVAIDLPSQTEGCVYILGSEHDLAKVAHPLMQTFLKMDKDAMYNSYNMNFVAVEESQLADLGYNIVCPIKNPISNNIEYVVGSCEVALIPSVVTSVINQAETHLKAWANEMIAMVAQDNLDYFRSVINQVIDTLYPEPELKESLILEDMSLDCCLPQVCKFARVPNSSEERPRKAKETAKKNRKNTIVGISRGLSSSTNLDRDQITEYINQLNVNELRTILNNVLQENPESLKNIKKNLYDLSSKYVLKIRESEGHGKARYDIVISNDNRTEYIRFTHKPSLCIFVLFVLDRVRFGHDVQCINLRARKKEFCELYEELFNVEDRGRVEEVYEEIFYRNNGERMRSGRSSQYYSDIYKAFVKELGETDSIPFQVGDKQPLKQSPQKIELAENLQRFARGS